MLKYLREGEGYRNIWIDAVCINQADNEERGKQAAMMGGVYACADCVLIWTERLKTSIWSY
jgi:hypothetical protein